MKFCRQCEYFTDICCLGSLGNFEKQMGLKIPCNGNLDNEAFVILGNVV